MSTIPVKWYRENMQGAPRLSGTAGDIIALLDACLINGFNVTAPDSLSVADGVASLYYSGGGHGYVQHQVIAVSGATPETLNGEWRVSEVDANYVRFAAPGEPDGTASGTIGVRTAPLGWAKEFSGTNKAVYRSTDITGSRLYLRVDDTAAQYAYARGYEEMSDVDTGTGLFPTAAQSSFGSTWAKSSAASTAARNWLLVGDSAIFYLLAAWHTTYPNNYDTYVYGDISSIKTGDAFRTIIHGSTMQTPSYTATKFVSLESATGKYIARAMSQTGTAIAVCGFGSGVSNVSGASAASYPGAADNGLHLHEPIVVVDGTTKTGSVRGTMPGVLQCMQNVPLTHGDIVLAAADVVIMAAACDSTSVARVAFNLTRSWR